jgi:hypothetical protein
MRFILMKHPKSSGTTPKKVTVGGQTMVSTVILRGNNPKVAARNQETGHTED